MDEYTEVTGIPTETAEVLVSPDTPIELVSEDIYIEILVPPVVYLDILTDLQVEEVEVTPGYPIYIGGTSGSRITGEVPTGAINGVNRDYVTANIFASGSLQVYANGLRMRQGADYNITGAKNFNMLQALLVGDNLIVDYLL
jgi:hypothetical protein